MIMDYNRVVKDLNGYTPEQFLDKVSSVFDVTLDQSTDHHPSGKGEFTMYLEGK